jgi:hypothetical protein
MLKTKSFVLFALLLVLGLSCPRPSSAEFVALGNDNHFRPYGITDSGLAVVEDLNCGVQMDTCYETYSFSNDGSLSAPIITSNPPSLLYSVDSSCGTLPPGFSYFGDEACNNGYFAIGAAYTTPTTYTHGGNVPRSQITFL